MKEAIPTASVTAPIPRIGLGRLLLVILAVPGVYVLLVICLLGTTGLAASLSWLAWNTHYLWIYAIALCLGALFVACACVYGILKALLTPQKAHALGKIIPSSHAPKLHAFVHDICRKMNTRPPDFIVLVPYVACAVTQARLSSMDGEFRGRHLLIGLPLLSFLSQDELRAALAHEMAHFTGRDIALSSFVCPIYKGAESAVEALDAAALNLQDGDRFSWLIALPMRPTYWIIQTYQEVFHQLFRPLDRSREIRADIISARLCGPQATADMLLKVYVVSELFDMIFWRDNSSDNSYQNFRAAVARTPDRVRAVQERVLAEPDNPDSVHPSLRLRVSLLGIAPAPVKATQSADAAALIPHLNDYEIFFSRQFAKVAELVAAMR